MNALARLNRKDTGYQFVRDHGGRVPSYGVYQTVSEAIKARPEGAFVLKPRAGHSSKGVYLLRPERHGSFFCIMNGRRFEGPEDIVKEYERALEKLRGVISRAVIVEQYVEDSLGFDVPLDYKVYAFATGSAIVMQRYAPAHLPKKKWAFQFYDTMGNALGLIRLNTQSDVGISLKPPENFPELVKVADHLVKQAGVSFVRTDLYSSRDGVVFGEFTPVPNAGKEAFEPEFDRMLGERWAESLSRLGLSYFKQAGDGDPDRPVRPDASFDLHPAESR